MATLTRTIRIVVVAVAAMALMAPAAQARPIGLHKIGLPVSNLQTHAQHASWDLPGHRAQQLNVRSPGPGQLHTSILKNKLQLPPPVTKISVTHSTPTASGGRFDWTDASIGATFATLLIGLGISGIRMGQRRTAQV